MKFDVDVSGLVPGSIIEQSTCEKVVNISRNESMYDYQFALMQLAEHVQRLLWKIGNEWTVTTKNGAIVVLTHEQASKYNAAKFINAIGKMRRCNRRLLAVDISQLPKESRFEHDEAIARQSRILQGMRTRGSVKLVPASRTVPLGG